MPDFNTKKDLLRRLRAKKERNKALWLPCTAAELCVKAWYAAACRMGLIFSRGGTVREDKPKAKRQDDIVYVGRPLLGRVVSAVLALSLVMMFVPEMEIKAAAAEITGNWTVDIGNETGVQVWLDTDNSTEGNYYFLRMSDYNAVKGYSVNVTKCDVGYQAINIQWKLNETAQNAVTSNSRINLVGYELELYKSGSGTPIGKKTYATDQTETMSYTFANGVDSAKIGKDDSIYVQITPKFNILEYVYAGALPDSGNSLGSITISSNTYRTETGLETRYPTGTDYLTPNAKMSIPELTVYQADGTASSTPAEFEAGESVTLKWTESTQSGGNDDDNNKKADSYNVYRYNVTEGNYYEYDKKQGTETTLSDLTPGTHYKFFVEAERTVWSSDNYGIISSSITSNGANEYESSAKSKFEDVYSKYAKDVYIAPAQPTLTLTPDATNHLIKISWSYVGNADGFVLVRSDHNITDEEYETAGYKTLTEYLLATESTDFSGLKWLSVDTGQSNKTYSDTDIVADQNYWYYGVSYIQIGENRFLYSTPRQRSANMSLTLEAPQNLKAVSADGKVTLTWDKVTNADGYILTITKLTDKDGNAVNESVEIGNLKSTTYVHETFKGEDILNGEKYKYEVQAYANVPTATEKQLTSDYCYPRTVTVGVPLNVPQDLKLTTTDGTVNISWSSLSGAEGYLLYYKKNSSDYSDSNVFDVAKTSYTHTGLNNDDKYTYYVVAYKTVNGVRVYSDPSDEAWIIVGVPLDAPKDFTGTTSDGRVDLTWSAVSGAEGYILHIISSTGSEQTIDLSKPGFQHTGLTNGTTYTYYVQAYKVVNGVRIYSDSSTASANRVTLTVGDSLDAPKDFTAVTTDGQVELSWTAVSGAEGYVLYAYGNGKSYQFDLSKTKYTHTGLDNGDSWTYYLAAYKTINGSRFYSSATNSITVTVGVSLNAPIDLVATAGNRQVDLSWSAVTGAEGYVVYLYNTNTLEFEPITVVSGTKYSHTGLKNGTKYTYMVAAFKTVSGERRYGEYSMSVDAIPTTGSNTDIDHALNVRGTTPYGISHSEYISAAANHGAFDESVDVYFSTNNESTEAVKDVLKGYADGLSSFIIYPFDISIYEEGTLVEIDPYDGYSVTITMPVPDKLIAYRDYITVVHIGEHTETDEGTEEIGVTDVNADDWLPTSYGSLEVLPSAIVDIDNVWCIQFVCSSFSPYAFVIYKDHILDVSAGGGVIASSFSDSFNSGLLLFTAFPDFLPNNKKLKVITGGRKRYRIKSIEKIAR